VQEAASTLQQLKGHDGVEQSGEPWKNHMVVTHAGQLASVGCCSGDI